MDFMEIREKINELYGQLQSCRVKRPEDAVETMMRHANHEVEGFYVITLDGANVPIKVHALTQGTVNRCLIHPRDVFRQAIIDNAAAVIVAHNHPSGSLEPSIDDDAITKRLKEAGSIIGIEILDHIVFSRTASWSYLKHNKI
jgi:DNA repair protein RadC